MFLILEREVGPQQSYQRGRDTNLPRLYCVESGGPAGETHLTVFPSPVPRSSLNLGCSTNRIIVAVRTSASFDNLGITRNNSLTLLSGSDGNISLQPVSSSRKVLTWGPGSCGQVPPPPDQPPSPGPLQQSPGEPGHCHRDRLQ